MSQWGRYLINHSTFHSVTGIKAEIEDCSVKMGKIPGIQTSFYYKDMYKGRVEDSSVTMGKIPDKPFIFADHDPFYYRYKGTD